MAKAAVRLSLDDGTDLADKINPRLIDLTLNEKSGEESDTVEFTLHNHDGALLPPKKGIYLSLAMGWESGDNVALGLVDKGRFKVDDVKRSGPPDICTITARATDLTGNYRKRTDKAWHDTTLGAILTEIAGNDGSVAQIHPDLANIAITGIEQHGKSNMAFVRDLGRRYDAVATWKNKILIFMPRGSTTTAGGTTIPELHLQRKASGNHDGWTWSFGTADREDHDGAEAQYHDHDAGHAKTVKVGGGKRKRLKKMHSSQSHATAAAKSEHAKNKRGQFTFEYDLVLGDPAIIPNRKITLSGWDSEIDGIKWLVKETTHKYDGSGLTTSLQMESA